MNLNGGRVRAVARKEIRDYRRNRFSSSPWPPYRW